MLKLISVNIETDAHHDTVVPFLKKENPDTVCLQEVFESDLPMYEETLGMKSFFKPMSVHPSVKKKDGTRAVVGIAILSRFDAIPGYYYYSGDESNTPIWERSKDLFTYPHIANYVVLWVEFIIEGKSFRIATTHLPVTPHTGISTPYQIRDAQKLIDYISKFEDIIICGDFNAPRGKETFAMFEEKYKDNIPLEYDSSLDPKLHRVPELRLVVDTLFSTDGYRASRVELVDGLSDHKAVVANIEKVK